MRLALLIKDSEYRDAFVQNTSDSNADLLIDIISQGEQIESDALIITDAKPADFDADILAKIEDRTVFLSQFSSSSNSNSPNQLFKYSSVSRLLADISDAYARWRGIDTHNSVGSKIIACCSDSDSFSGSRCTRIARQIVYRQGGRVLILPLGYINEHSLDYTRDINTFAHLMYKVRKGRIDDSSIVAYTDGFGISRLMLPEGRNPIAYLDEDDLSALILELSKVFDSLILDIAGCYRPENLAAIRNSGLVICLETGRRRINFEEIVPKENLNKVKIIKVDEESDEDPAIDEIIGELYGCENEN